MTSRLLRYTTGSSWLTPDELLPQASNQVSLTAAPSDSVEVKPLLVESVLSQDPVLVESIETIETQLPQTSDYFQLQQTLFRITLTVSFVITICLAVAYSVSVAANYLLGALGGILYLTLLGRSVAQLGKSRSSLGFSRLAVFVGLVVVATRVQSLQILPIFFGFLSYKVSFLVYLVQMLTRPSRSQVKP